MLLLLLVPFQFVSALDEILLELPHMRRLFFTAISLGFFQLLLIMIILFFIFYAMVARMIT